MGEGLLSLEEKLSEIKSYSEELGLDLRNPEDRFKWFLASILFAKRISSEIAKRTFQLFLRELRGIWDRAKPKPSRIAMEIAEMLGLEKIEPYESALVRLRLEYCKKKRCMECPVRKYCGALRK